MAAGRNVGSANAHSRWVDETTLELEPDGEHFVDTKTKTRFNATGHAISGPRKGVQLEPIVEINHFWFSWAAFQPDTRVYSDE